MDEIIQKTRNEKSSPTLASCNTGSLETRSFLFFAAEVSDGSGKDDGP